MYLPVVGRWRLNKATFFLTSIFPLWLWHLDSELDTPLILLASNKWCTNSGPHMCSGNITVTSYNFKKLPTYSNTFDQAILFHRNKKKVRQAVSAEFLLLKKTQTSAILSLMLKPKRNFGEEKATDFFTASFKMTKINRRVNMLIRVLLIRENLKRSLCLMGNPKLPFFQLSTKNIFQRSKFKNSFPIEVEI